MNPVELRKNLSEHMKQLVKEYSEKGIKVFFAYRIDGYLGIYEMDDPHFWQNGKFIKLYKKNGELKNE